MSCLIILFTVELAGSYLGHVPTSSEKYLRQINYGRKLTCFGCSPRIGYHRSICYWACSFCLCLIPSSSDMDASMRGLGGRTLQDGAVGVLQAIMMVVFVYSFQKSYIILFFSLS